MNASEKLNVLNYPGKDDDNDDAIIVLVVILFLKLAQAGLNRQKGIKSSIAISLNKNRSNEY
ncbi:hypothetical protein T08_2171 [Trichinella sp. T8]|uniref:Uncharacterized protein n=1 Tax=Trichinella murrelli TaxID=144512 RepID=A0A0V0U320_9BILA|nr:hypothetical protein T05_3292 [Trichinella murrelli]KRZ89416.1 hypothetical protein T08_2171 [Trichinella sp. T8]